MKTSFQTKPLSPPFHIYRLLNMLHSLVKKYPMLSVTENKAYSQHPWDYVLHFPYRDERVDEEPLKRIIYDKTEV